MLKSSGINTADGSIRSNSELVVSNFAVKIALASGQSERAAGIKIGRRFWIRSESVCNPDWQSSNPRSTRCPRNGRKERRENGSEEPRPPAADWFISIAFSLRSFAASTSRSGIQLKRDGDALPFSFFSTVSALEEKHECASTRKSKIVFVSFFEREARQVQTGNLIILLPCVV